MTLKATFKYSFLPLLNSLAEQVAQGEPNLAPEFQLLAHFSFIIPALFCIIKGIVYAQEDTPVCRSTVALGQTYK